MKYYFFLFFQFYVEDLFNRFNNINCPVLHGIPKLFIIQACRGEKIDKGIEVGSKGPKSGSNFWETSPTWVYKTFNCQVITKSGIWQIAQIKAQLMYFKASKTFLRPVTFKANFKVIKVQNKCETFPSFSQRLYIPKHRVNFDESIS